VTSRNALHAVIVACFVGPGFFSVPLPLHAAQGFVGNPVHQARQPTWRPAFQAPRPPASVYRWRPLSPVVREAGGGDRRASSDVNRRWARSARPLTRGGELASQFRPDHRTGEAAGQPQASMGQDSDLHAQFRPIKPSTRKAYEELYEQPQPIPLHQSAPVMPYMPPPVPMTPYWPYW